MKFKKSNDYVVKKEKRNNMFKRITGAGAVAVLSIGLVGPASFYNPITASAANNDVDVFVIDDDGSDFVDEDFELDSDFDLTDDEIDIEIDLGEDVDNEKDDASGNNDETYLDSISSGDPDEDKERAERKKKLELSAGTSGTGGMDPDELKEREERLAALGLSSKPTDAELEEALDEEDLENDSVELEGDGIIIDEDDEGIDIFFDEDIELDDEFID